MIKWLKQERFLILLFSLLLMMVIHPLFPQEYLGINLVDVFLLFICLSSINAISKKKGVMIAAVSLIILSIVAETIVDMYTADEIADTYLEWVKLAAILKPILSIAFFTVISILILLFTLKDEKITRDKLCAALCVYLFMGLIWAYGYYLLDLCNEGAIEFTRVYDRDDPVEYLSFSRFMYFSYVTLTTLGYGDICPVMPVARNLAILEAIVGQLYLAILMARLVALHITHSVRKE